jgi:hypothetical protein
MEEFQNLLEKAKQTFHSRPPLAEFYIDQAYELNPQSLEIILFRLQIKTYTKQNNDKLFNEVLELFELNTNESETHYPILLQLYFTYLLFNNRLSELESNIGKYSKYLEHKSLQLPNYFLQYIKTLDIKVFDGLHGFNESDKEMFFRFFTDFPVLSKDISKFCEIIKPFFSEETILRYKTFTSVQTNNYSDDLDESFNDLAFKYILSGDVENGWKRKVFDTLHAVPEHPYFDKSKFTNGDLTNKTVLITTEQGFGDNIIYFRMWLKVFENNPTTKFMYCVNGPLYRFFKENIKTNNVILFNQKEHFPLYSQISYDYFYPDFSAPLVLGLTDNTLSNFNYLDVHETVKMDKSIGVFWYSVIRQNFIKHKVVPLEVFYEKLNLKKYQDEGYKIYSLQKEHTEEDKQLMSKLGIIDISDRFGDFYDTAKYVKNMDKVFSIDTSIQHLSNALDKDTTVVFNYFKGYHYDDKGLYPNIEKIDLELDCFKYLNKKD